MPVNQSVPCLDGDVPGCRDTAVLTHKRWPSFLFQTETCRPDTHVRKGQTTEPPHTWGQNLLSDDVSAFDDLLDGSLLDGGRLLEPWGGRFNSSSTVCPNLFIFQLHELR